MISLAPWLVQAPVLCISNWTKTRVSVAADTSPTRLLTLLVIQLDEVGICNVKGTVIGDEGIGESSESLREVVP